MTDDQVTGAIDWFLIEAPNKEINGELVPPLLDLVDRRLIRILDVLVLVKRGEGDFDVLDDVRSRPRAGRRARRAGGRIVRGAVGRRRGGGGRADDARTASAC